MKDRIEAILFAAGRYVDEDHIAQLLQEDVRKVRKGLQALKEQYDLDPETSLQVVQEDKSWKLHVKDTYLDLVSKLVSDKEIAKTVLETLAIIAWKTPILQAEVIKIRGPAAYDHVSELLQREFITKEAFGRSFKLKITDKFFEYFDVEGREDIKKLFKQVDEKAAAEQVEIDKQKQVYEKKVEAVKAAVSGENDEQPEVIKQENTSNTSASDSAQKTPVPKDLFTELEEEVAALGKDVEDLVKTKK